jgi:hypothetical protein
MATTTESTARESPVGSFVGVVARPQTYRNLFYLAVAFPLGVAYFVVLVTGFSLGVGLAVTLVGIPILLATVWLVRALSLVERRLATTLLGVEIPDPEPATSEELWDRVVALLTSPVTWLGLVFLLGKFVLGIATFAVLAVLGALTFAFVTAPLYYDLPNAGVDVGVWQVTTFPEALVLSVLGVVFLFVSLHAVNGVAWGWGRIAAVLLDGSRESF